MRDQMKLGTLTLQGLFVLALALLGAALSLVVGQLVLLELSRDRLEDYADDVLAHGVIVASQNMRVLRIVQAGREPFCSDTNLTDLRYLLFQNEYLHDIGRIRDGYLVCSAIWGRLKEPISLPPPQRQQANGDRLWVNIEGLADHRVMVDMAGFGSAVTFTAPTAFKLYEKPAVGLSALLLTADGQHIFRAFGDTAGLRQRFTEGAPDLELGPRLTTSRCDPAIDVCVVAALSNVSILQQEVPIWAGAAGSGGLTLGLLGVALVLRWRSQSSLPQRVRRAVARGRLRVVYQPLVRLQDEHTVGVEALARLTDEHNEAISPEIFIPAAEAMGLMPTITRQVIHMSLQEMRSRLRGTPPFHVHINLAVADVLDPSLCDDLNEEVDRLGIPRDRVVLEITERSTADHTELRQGVEHFRKEGYRFFIDDFGTGYSNLAYLAKLPITGIKLDKMFTKAIGKAAVSSTIVEKICLIASELDLELVAEGVETREQADHVLALNPDAIAQGWLFGKPVPADQL